MRIDAWEWRWPLNTYRNRDASKLSRALLDRLAEAEAMSLDDYRRDIAQRDKNRALYAELAGECEACISLSAPSAAPMLSDERLSLGLQVAGFVNGDANAVASAAAIAGLF